MSTPLAAYARWHAGETLPRLGTPLALFALLGGLQLSSLIAAEGLAALRVVGSEPNGAAIQVYGLVLMPAMTLGAIALASGWPSLDRERQYFRFLFSHPVPAWGFYLQKFVIATILFGLAMMLIPVAFSLFISPVPILAVGASSWLYALLYGSLALLCGALVNKDGLIFIGVILLGNALQQVSRGLPEWVRVIADMLPPFVKAGGIREALLRGATVDMGDLTHVLLYSLGMLVGALVLIRRAPLAR